MYNFKFVVNATVAVASKKSLLTTRPTRIRTARALAKRSDAI